MLRQSTPLQLSVRSQMMVEKMNAFYMKNWDKEHVFDLSQRVVPRYERHWWGKIAPKMTGQMKTWTYSSTHTPYHKSDDGQSTGEAMTKTVKKKYFWCDPPADYFLEQNHPGGRRDYHLAWENFHKELEKAAYSEPEQLLTLLHDLNLEGWTVEEKVYERAEILLERSRERRALGIKPTITLSEVQGKERWPGANPVWEEEWDPILPFTHASQSNPKFTYKPLQEADWEHNPWTEGKLPYPQPTQFEDYVEFSAARANVLVQKEADERFKQLLHMQNKDLMEQLNRDPTSFAGNPENIKYYVNEKGKYIHDENDTPIILMTDVDHFIELFYPNSAVDLLFFWKYTSDHIMFRHFVFEKTGKTLLEFTEPERFAIITAALNVKRVILFEENSTGRNLPNCWTDEDYIEEVGEEEYRQFLKLEQRLVDEHRRKYMRLWSTEVAQEEKLDHVVEMTRMKHEDEFSTGIYGHASKVKDRLDRKKWAIKEPSRPVLEHEKELAETRESRRALFDDEMETLALEAELSYGSELYGKMEKRRYIRSKKDGTSQFDADED